MKINQYFFSRTLRRQPRRNVAYPDYKQVSSVLIIYESEWQERNPEIRAIVQQLHDEDKQVVSWGYVKKDKILSPILPESRVLGPKDFNLLGRPKQDLRLQLTRKEYDLMIDLTTHPILELQYVTLLTQAKFKIGAYDASYYDMVVPCTAEAGVEYIFQQIQHYLTLIKSAD